MNIISTCPFSFILDPPTIPDSLRFHEADQIQRWFQLGCVLLTFQHDQLTMGVLLAETSFDVGNPIAEIRMKATPNHLALISKAIVCNLSMGNVK